MKEQEEKVFYFLLLRQALTNQVNSFRGAGDVYLSCCSTNSSLSDTFCEHVGFVTTFHSSIGLPLLSTGFDEFRSVPAPAPASNAAACDAVDCCCCCGCCGCCCCTAPPAPPPARVAMSRDGISMLAAAALDCRGGVGAGEHRRRRSAWMGLTRRVGKARVLLDGGTWVSGTQACVVSLSMPGSFGSRRLGNSVLVCGIPNHDLQNRV